jgi:hypothetical protein
MKLIQGIRSAINAVLTSYTSGANTALANTDTVVGAFGKVQGQLDAKAPLASPAFTGTPTAPTAAIGTDTTQIATTAFLQDYIDTLAPTELSYASGSQTFATALTLANVTGTTFTFPSTGWYEVEYIIEYDANATSTGVWFSLNGTAVHSFLNAIVVVGCQNADRSATVVRAFNAGSASISTSGPTGAYASVKATIKVTTVGTILLRCSSEITVASGIIVQDVKGFMRKFY